MADQKISRRKFTKTTATGVLAGLALNSCKNLNEKKPMDQASLLIVDTHQHLWDRTKFDLPWLGDKTDGIAKSHVTADFIKETEGLNVTRAIYMEVDVREDQQEMEAEHVIALSKDPAHPTVAAVVSGRPSKASFKDFANKYKDEPLIKGFRRVLQGPDTPKGHCLSETFVSNVRHLGEIGKSFDICMRPSELDDAVKLADLCKETRLILDHCGNGDPKAFMSEERRGKARPWHDADHWRAGIDELAARDNVICKISGIVARAPKDNWSAEDLAPLIDHCLDTFGPDRVIYGGDWPVCKLTASYRDWVVALKEVISHRSLKDQQKLLSENAVKFYGIA